MVGTAGGGGAISEIVVAVTMIISVEMGVEICVTVTTGTAGGGTIAGTREEVTTETETEETEAEEVATTDGVVMILEEEGAVVEV